MSDTWRSFDLIEATFTPKRLDTLRPECVPYIGQRSQWSAAWPIEESDSLVYAGQWAFMPHPPGSGWTGWVPEEDLSAIEMVRPMPRALA